MRRYRLLCLVWASVVFDLSDLAAGDAEPAILSNSPDFPHLRPFQSRLQPDPRPRLSSSQQQQILSDVQQHQRRYNQPNQDNPPQLVAFPGPSHQSSSKSDLIEQPGFPSLAKYRVDRAKQQQHSQILQQQSPIHQQQSPIHQQQSPIHQQQSPIHQQQSQIHQQNRQPDSRNVLQTAQSQRYQPPSRQQQLNVLGSQRFLSQEELANGQAIFEEEQNIRLDEYYEKQRQLEQLKKQREQLILEQREIKRQQELLRLQHIRQQTSTTSISPAIASSSPTPTNYVTTTSPLLLSSPTARRITPAESELFLKAIATHQKKFTTTTSKPIPTTHKTVPKVRQERVGDASNDQEIPKDLLSLIQAQQPQLLAAAGKNKPQIKIIYQTERPSPATPSSTIASSSSTLENELLLKQLKLALAQSTENDARNVTTRDLVLPNGRKLQVIQSPSGLSSIVPNDGTSQFQTVTRALQSTSTSTTTIRPAKAILDELTKGVLPPGADFEVLRHKDDGKLEDVGKSPINNQPGKKVTFVVLEEQPDGSYKVQGVKGNAKENGVDVDSIVERIKKGELKLPPPSYSPAASTKSDFVSKKETTTVTSTPSSVSYARETNTVPNTPRPTTIKYTGSPVTSRQKESSLSADYFPYVTVSPNSISPSDNYVTSASTTSAHVYNSLANVASTPRNPSSRYEDAETSSRYTSADVESSRFPAYSTQFTDVSSTTVSSPTFPSTTTNFPRTNSYVHFSPNGPSSTRSSVIVNSSPNFPGSAAASQNLVLEDFQLRSTVPSFLENAPNTIMTQQESMTGLLRREGLFAMAKYLRQSGLDIVLNETGPYTIFVPTDKAFRTLLVQLGGPDKAEQKFRENPRLLSGLLLHHVIPGAFRIDSLQDEMTGVSLAGTQLRVNVYDMHDQEWNDVKVTTINGAKVAPNKRDIEIPQGIAHAVDRVMFPLPVGDLIQTLQADRERRFLTFLKILHASGLEDTLAGTKTFTVFAPTDTAFATSASENGRPVWIEADGPEAARDIISRHIMPSTLYTGGMRYYHQRETLRPQVTLSIQKNGGRVRVNESQIVTQNVPATNGVVHAIDAVL